MRRAAGRLQPDARRAAAVDPEVAAAVRHAVNCSPSWARGRGGDPGFADPVEAFHTLWFSGAARVVAAPDAAAARRCSIRGCSEICGRALRYSALDYLAAVDVRMALGMRMGRFHETYDLLVTPTCRSPLRGGRRGARGLGAQRWTGWTPFTYPFNLTQQPAATVPCGVDVATGCRSGVQLVGARHADALVLRASHALFEALVREGTTSAGPVQPRG